MRLYLNAVPRFSLVVQKSQAVEAQQQYEQEVKKHGQAIDEKNQLREELDRACARLLEAEAARNTAVQALGYALKMRCCMYLRRWFGRL